MTIPITEICKLIGLQLGIRKVTETSHLRDDLGAESLDIQNIVTALEDKYRVRINDEDLDKVATVTDFHQLVCNA